MKKHQFVKADCECSRRATVFTCKHCGLMEYSSPEELRNMEALKAVCTGDSAPDADPVEAFKGKMGGTFDCLSPDYEQSQAG